MALAILINPKSVLKQMGWDVSTTTKYRQAVRDFQSGWNLGTALTVDGNAGMKTKAAMKVSIDRRKKGLPDFSAHFNAKEFACKCWGRYASCRRIVVPRSTVQMAEKWRAATRPFSPDRAYRCPGYNKDVNGASRSQHLVGRALDVPVTDISLSRARAAIGGKTGIGLYNYRYVRHIDNRGEQAQWNYGTYNGSVIKV